MNKTLLMKDLNDLCEAVKIEKQEHGECNASRLLDFSGFMNSDQSCTVRLKMIQHPTGSEVHL